MTMNKENRSAASLRRSAVAAKIRLREEWTALKGIPEVPSKNGQSPIAKSHRPTKKKGIGVTKKKNNSLIDKDGYHFADKNHNDLADKEGNLFTDKVYHNIADKKSRRLADKEGHRSTDKEGHLFTDKENHNIADKKSRRLADKEGHRSTDKEGHLFTDKENHNIADKKSRRLAEKEGHRSTDKEGHLFTDKENHNIADKKNRRLADKEGHRSTDKESQLTNKKGSSLSDKPTSKKNQKPEMSKATIEASEKTCEVLRGVVALVEVGARSRALALGAALRALGATVVPAWSPLVTHLIWAEGGCRATRAKARVLASRLVSPLWIEACAVAKRRLPEATFPAAARPSDLPSPKTLRRLLKMSELDYENISWVSEEVIVVTSRDRSAASTSSAVLEPPTPLRRRSDRRSFPSVLPEASQESNKKEFVPKENEPAYLEILPSRPRQLPDLRQLADLRQPAQPRHRPKPQLLPDPRPKRYRDPFSMGKYNIVLTGMSDNELNNVCWAVHKMGARVQRDVNKYTTHVLLGNKKQRGGSNLTFRALMGAARGCFVLKIEWALQSYHHSRWLGYFNYEVPELRNLCRITHMERTCKVNGNKPYAINIFKGMRIKLAHNMAKWTYYAKLVKLCGARISNLARDFVVPEVVVGPGPSQVSPLWIYNCITSGRVEPSDQYKNGWRHQCILRENNSNVSDDLGEIIIVD